MGIALTCYATAYLATLIVLVILWFQSSKASKARLNMTLQHPSFRSFRPMQSVIFRLMTGVLLLLLLSCGRDPEQDVHRIHLNQTVVDNHLSRYFYVPGQGLDSVAEQIQLVAFPGHGRIKSRITAKDVVLGRGDSIRIGIIQPLEKAFGEDRSIQLPDQLLLSPYGQDSIPISPDQENVGPVTGSTVFRIDRSFYSLNSLDSSRQHIEVSRLPRRPKRPVTAQLNTRFKKVPVKTLNGKDSLILRDKERMTILYFWSVGVNQGASLLELNEVLRQLGPAAPKVVAISRADSNANLKAFQAEHQLTTPLYQSNGDTCSGLHCHAYLPYAVIVNEEGRIITHHLRHAKLIELLRDQ